jgi:hypothetical protein
MPVRTGYVSTEVDGDVLTSANFNKLPGGWIGYAEVTANQAGIVAETDLTSLTVTVTVGTSRRIRVRAQARASKSVADGNVVLYVKEGATYLTGIDAQMANTTAETTIAGDVILTPTSGAHTYKLAMNLAGTGTVTMGAGAAYPAFILVEDIGPSS